VSRLCFAISLCLVPALLFSLLAPARALPPEEAEARAILLEIDELWRASSSQGQVRMQVRTANYTRTLVLETWSKGKDRSLVRISAPLKEKDTASLKSGATMYTYLPRTDRTIRLTSSMMMGSWMTIWSRSPAFPRIMPRPSPSVANGMESGSSSSPSPPIRRRPWSGGGS